MTAESMAPVAGDMPTHEGDLTIEGHGIEPIPASARYGSINRVFTVWFTPNLVPAAFAIGLLAAADFLQVGFVTGLAGIIVGNIVGAALVGLLATMGPKTGMAQLPVARLPFGKTIVLPGLLNWISCIGWDGVNSVFGAAAISILTGLDFVVSLVIIVAYPGRTGNHRTRGHPLVREVDGDRAGRHVRGRVGLDLRPGLDRHGPHRWLHRTGPAGRVHPLDVDHGELRPGVGPVRVGLHPVSAGRIVRIPDLLVDGPGARAVRRAGSRPSACSLPTRHREAARSRRSTTCCPDRSWPHWP